MYTNILKTILIINLIATPIENSIFNTSEEYYSEEYQDDYFEEELELEKKFNSEVLTQISSIKINSNITAEFRKFLKLDWSFIENRTIFGNFIPAQFIRGLYRVVTDPETGITVQNYPYGASVVWSLPEKDPTSTNLFRFNLTGIESETILEAELHVYRIKSEDSIPSNQPPYYILRVYQIMPNKSIYENPDVHQLLNVHYISASIFGSQIFRVKRAVKDWLTNNSTNLGFLVTATTVFNEPINVKFVRGSPEGHEYQPTLILFTQTRNKELGNLSREIDLDFNSDKHKLVSNYLSGTNCIRQPLYINFADFNLNHLIIAPKGFETYECKGSCKFPIDFKYRSNHAIIQSILEKAGHSTIQASCVPVELKPLSILYLDSNFNVKLENYDDMVIINCGCH